MSELEARSYSFEDIEKNKVVAALAYIIFFLPLMVCPESPFGKFHANQGLVLLIVGIERLEPPVINAVPPVPFVAGAFPQESVEYPGLEGT